MPMPIAITVATMPIRSEKRARPWKICRRDVPAGIVGAEEGKRGVLERPTRAAGRQGSGGSRGVQPSGARRHAEDHQQQEEFR